MSMERGSANFAPQLSTGSVSEVDSVRRWFGGCTSQHLPADVCLER